MKMLVLEASPTVYFHEEGILGELQLTLQNKMRIVILICNYSVLLEGRRTFLSAIPMKRSETELLAVCYISFNFPRLSSNSCHMTSFCNNTEVDDVVLEFPKKKHGFLTSTSTIAIIKR